MLADPGELLKDQKKYQECSRELARLRPVAEGILEHERLRQELSDVEILLQEETGDQEHEKLYEEEKIRLVARLAELKTEIEDGILSGSDSEGDKSIIVEIRAGTGGEEAALFARDLFRLYSRYAGQNGLKVEVMDSSIAGKGGFKEIVFAVTGQGAYSKFKYESGTHRVQRVPETEASGRIHTSASTVAVLLEPDEVDVDIKPEDIRIDICRAGGPGGQGVNTTDSAVQILHIPTGLLVRCQDERSQHKNKAKAMRVLRARLYELEREKKERQYSEARKKQVGSGDRSEKIRTYNFPDKRVTDHRIGVTLYSLDQVMEGNIEEFVRALAREERKQKLEQQL